MNRKLLIIARAIDHRVGKDDYDAPNIPILTQYEAWTGVSIYNDRNDSCVVYTCSREELKGLADFIYKTIGEKK